MKTIALFICTILLGACAAPEISDWPPEAPPVSEEVIQSYVDRYARDDEAPRYGPEDIKALNILMKRRARTYDEDDDLSRFRSNLESVQAKNDDDRDVTEGPGRSKAEIDAIEDKINRRFESHHDRRHQLRSKYGL